MNSTQDLNNLFIQFNEYTPGCAVCVVKDDQIIMERFYGLANLEKKVPITSNTVFRLASLTKPFTAMGIMILKERGMLDFDDTLTQFCPDFPNYGREITIRQLLTHTSGMPDHEQPLYKKIQRGEEPTIYDSLEVLKEQKNSLFQPGTQYNYSDAGYVILALIIEKISGQTYSQFLFQNIFRPSNMESTLVADETKPMISNRAYGYKKTRKGYELFDYNPLNYIIGDEGVYSNVTDLTKWWRTWNTDILVSKKTLKEALTPQKLRGGKISRCGFSWFITCYQNRMIVFQDGVWVGFTNIILTDSCTNTTVLVLSNTTEYATERKRVGIGIKILKILGIF